GRGGGGNSGPPAGSGRGGSGGKYPKKRGPEPPWAHPPPPTCFLPLPTSRGRDDRFLYHLDDDASRLFAVARSACGNRHTNVDPGRTWIHARAIVTKM